jgi:hypothetical protein
MTDPYRIRSAETWAQARDDYLAGMDAESVCRRHDLGLSAFRRRARKNGWRRLDQADPPPRDPAWDLDLSIYDDVSIDDQIVMADQRFIQALAHGRPVEAARWRRLHRQLRDDRWRGDSELFPERTPAETLARMAAERDREDAAAAAELRLLSARAAEVRPAPAAAAPEPARPENVHDVHSIFSSAHFPAEAVAPQSRADRRPDLPEARRRSA